MEYHGKKGKKINLIEKKACAINSLKEVNYFLSNLNKVCIIKKIIKIK